MASELAYDPAIDNCGGMPGCGSQRVLFTWFHAPAICCPRCYENLFGAAPDPGSVITLPPALTVAAVDPAVAEALGGLADAAQDVVTKAEVDRCGWSEDPYHRCRVCHDYAAGREREHPLAAGAQEVSGE